MHFSIWLENTEAKKEGSQSIILNYLMDKLSIRDPDVILQMNTNELDTKVVSDLMNRGIVATSNEDLLNRIKNGIVIKDLIDLLAGDKDGSAFTSPNMQTPPNSAKNLQPQQSIATN